MSLGESRNRRIFIEMTPRWERTQSPPPLEGKLYLDTTLRPHRSLSLAAFRLMLLKSAYTPEEIRQFVKQTPFRQCDIHTDTVGMEIWLTK